MSDLFVSKAQDGGVWSYALPTWFGLFLSDAEALYGPRDKAWTPLGIELWDNHNQTCPLEGNTVCIRLNIKTLTHHDFNLFNLAHETIHVLGPSKGVDITFLEEGVAVAFSLQLKHYNDKSFPGMQRRNHLCDPADKYVRALIDVELLTQHDREAVLKLRKIEPYLSRITPDQIVQVVPACPSNLARRLCASFR
ncbi:hypothetical protein [Bradyrhizobium sp. Ash2021]|uniref:hypothetical protein n=1 Tax=Bradyrhizobium sp. Ash2021 TaxID=2954771 RepID=UPI00281541EF|nr:hypothetical protein [Bradyrhizobium sp. Ash2021]WMT77087.1 hypothetical protein NL528_12395 [Bradyrhizobium sp. Ash2021]